jgi:hypothetical protein
MSESAAAAAAVVLGCPIAQLPCKYLGLPLTAIKISRTLLQPVTNRISGRLPGWIPWLMSFGGRVQMVNSVLTAIRNYFMACIEWDEGSINAVDKIRRFFLWKNREGQVNGGHCLVSWDIVTLPKKNGGLGIRNLRHHNRALIANLASKLLSDNNGPYFSWLANWYLHDTIPLAPTRNDSPLWKSLQAVIFQVQHATYCISGTGDRTAFWQHSWSELGRLCFTMPVLYSFD